MHPSHIGSSAVYAASVVGYMLLRFINQFGRMSDVLDHQAVFYRGSGN